MESFLQYNALKPDVINLQDFLHLMRYFILSLLVRRQEENPACKKSCSSFPKSLLLEDSGVT